jgi:hypothetical protein
MNKTRATTESGKRHQRRELGEGGKLGLNTKGREPASERTPYHLWGHLDAFCHIEIAPSSASSRVTSMHPNSAEKNCVGAGMRFAPP